MTRQSLYRLIDELPETELPSVARYIRSLHPFPEEVSLEDESFSPEQQAALAESWAQLKRGELIRFEDVIQNHDPGFTFDS